MKKSRCNPTVVSLFAGCGGSSLGYKWAGFREVLAVERDKAAIASFKRNFKSVPVWEGDICQLDGEVALAKSKMKTGDLDVLDGSPPCQGFSRCGNRKIGDTRNSLFKEYVRLLQVFSPRSFVMENVPGMVHGKMRLVFAECLAQLKDSGYKVRARVLNAMYYGVPQARKRLIFIGVRDDIGVEPSHPAAATKPVTVREALRNVVVVDKPGELTDKYGKLWDMIPQGKSASSILGYGFQACVKVAFDKPSCTLPASRDTKGCRATVHPEEPRALAISEAKSLSSFPDDFWLFGDYVTQWAQIGNAVPPKFMEHIARHVKGLLQWQK